MGKPLLSWTLEALKLMGISHVTVVVNPQMTLGEDYWRQWRDRFDQVDVVDQKISNGQAGGLLVALPKLESNFYVINATQCTAETLLPSLKTLDSEIGLLAMATDFPWLYGLVDFDQQTGLVKNIAEKPSEAIKQGYRLVGAYRLTKEFVTQLGASPLTDEALEKLLATWAVQGRVKTAVIFQDSPSLKYPWHLLDYKEYLWSKLDYQIHQTAIIAPTAIIRGEVFIGSGAVISDFAIIDGPAYIGPNAVVGQYCSQKRQCLRSWSSNSTVWGYF
jgi:glucose-1-phosphate thymidylyltransferase